MGNKPAEKNVSGATDDLVKQVSALVVVMESAPEAPVTATPSTNSKNTSLKRQRILREWSVASVVRTMRVNAVQTDDEEQQIDLDSHADMCIIGQHTLTVHDFNCAVNVVGYDPLKGIMTPNCWTVSAAVSYDCPMKWEVFIIEVHQAILIDQLHDNILCPMQMRMYDVKVNVIPKHLTDNTTDQTN